MKHIFVINPAAGKGKKLPAILSSITYACEELGVDFEIYHTATVGDGTRFVSQMCEKHPDEPMRFYACGGDGTLFEVLNGAVGYPLAEIAAVPSGTGNDFIRSFSNEAYFSDIKRQLHGKSEKIDLIKFNNKYCINVLNIGFDCDVVQRVSEFKRSVLVPSKMAYIVGILDVFAKSMGKNFKMLIDDRELVEREFILGALANARFYGGGFQVAPNALLNDGKMDLCLIDRISRVEFVKLIGKYKSGHHVNANDVSPYPCVHYQKCEKVLIESRKSIAVCTDGEVSPHKTLVVESAPKAISFSIPKGCRCIANSGVGINSYKIISSKSKDDDL